MSKKAYPTHFVIRWLTHLVFWNFTRYYGIRKHMPKEVKELKPPYLILGNHVGFWDPFVSGFFLPHFPHFVSSDAVFRNPLLRYFLTRLGTIPKKKNMRDGQVIRDIVRVINQGENVGIFPEAVRNWSGTTSPMDASIGKLIKLLGIPVVVPVLKGMNLMHPRWAYHLRKYPMEVEYKLLYSREKVQELDSQTLFEGLATAIYHDEVDYQRKRMKKIRSPKKAEHIGHALFLCPHCHSVDSFDAHKNDFSCNNCKYDIHINDYGFFERKTTGKLYFDNIRDWFNWQEKTFVGFVNEKIRQKSTEPLLSDNNMDIYKSNHKGHLVKIGEGDAQLFLDKIRIKLKDGENLSFNFNDLHTINPQTKERLEMFYKNDAYRIVGKKPGISALKWEIAVNVLWKEMGMDAKCVPYIRI